MIWLESKKSVIRSLQHGIGPTVKHQNTLWSSVRYPAGKITTYIKAEKSVIESIKIYGDFFGIGDVADVEDLLVGTRYEYADVLAKLQEIDTTHYFSRMTTEEVAKAIVA